MVRMDLIRYETCLSCVCSLVVAEAKRLCESSWLAHSFMSFNRSLQKLLTSRSVIDFGRFEKSLAKSSGGAVDVSWKDLRILV